MNTDKQIIKFLMNFRIKQLCRVRTLEEGVQNDLFPSVQMICSMSREFSRIWNQREEKLSPEPQDVGMNEDLCVSRRRINTQLNNFNKQYVEWKLQANQGLHVKNFVQV